MLAAEIRRRASDQLGDNGSWLLGFEQLALIVLIYEALVVCGLHGAATEFSDLLLHSCCDFAGRDGHGRDFGLFNGQVSADVVHCGLARTVGSPGCVSAEGCTGRNKDHAAL